MDAEIKAEWLKRLRSGNYAQTTGKLASLDSEGNVDGYCCLGVLCQIAVEQNVIPAPIPVSSNADVKCGVTRLSDNDRLNFGDNVPGSYDNSTTCLPEAVYTWAGIGGGEQENPSVLIIRGEVYSEDELYGESAEDEITFSLAELNDDHGKDFTDLADLIEKS